MKKGDGDSILTFRAFGKGKPVFILSGGPGHASFYLDPVAEQISQMGYQAIVINQYGTDTTIHHFDSTRVTLPQFVDDIERLRKHLGFESVVLLGHSWGGTLAMSYVEKYPHTTSGLILSCSSAFGKEPNDRFMKNLDARLLPADKAAINGWYDSVSVGMSDKRIMLEQRRIRQVAFTYDRANHQRLIDEVVNTSPFNPEVGNRMFADAWVLHEYPVMKNLKKYPSPVLVLEGRQDIMSVETSQFIQSCFSNAQLVIIEQCGHYPWIDNPKPYFQEIKLFLSKNIPGLR
ncbi:MAG: alpha/beta fold hydrolase [Bacteroidota bacterium]